MNLGERVKNKRIEMGMSQEELAHRMGYKERYSISKIECGRPVKQNIVVRLAKILNTTPSYLMGWEDEHGVEIDDPTIETFASSVGNRIKNIRMQKNYSVDELANMVGISPSKLSDMENGTDRGFDVALMYKFSNILSVAPCYFLQGEMLPDLNVVDNIKALCDINYIDIADMVKDLNISKKAYEEYFIKGETVPFSIIEKVCDYFNLTYAFFLCNDFKGLSKNDRLRMEIRLLYIVKVYFEDFSNYDITKDELDEIITYAKFLISKRKM